MVRQRCLIARVAALVTAALVWAAGPALAAGHGGGGGGHGGGGGGHGGGGHGGGGHGGGMHGGGVHGGGHGGGYYHGGGHGHYYHHGYYYPGFYGFGLGLGLGYYGGYYGGYYPGYLDSWYYGDYGPSTYTAADNYPYTTAPALSGGTSGYAGMATIPSVYPPPNENAIYVRVQVPEDADVWFEGQQTTQKGPVRFFESPPVAPGRNYVYHIRARWKENGQPVEQTRDVTVYAGDKFSIDFTKMQQREKMPAPTPKPEG